MTILIINIIPMHFCRNSVF